MESACESVCPHRAAATGQERELLSEHRDGAGGGWVRRAAVLGTLLQLRTVEAVEFAGPPTRCALIRRSSTCCRCPAAGGGVGHSCFLPCGCSCASAGSAAGCVPAHCVAAGGLKAPVLLRCVCHSGGDPFPKADGSDSSPDLSAQTPWEEQTAKGSRGGADHVSPSWSQKRTNWNWGYQENDLKSGSGTSPTRSKKKGNNYREKIRGRPEMGRKRQNDFTEHCSRLLGNCSQMGGGLYRAPSLREELNIVSSSAGKEGFDAYTRARQSASRRNHGKTMVSGFAEPAGMAAHCSSSRSLEIDIEYDSEDDQDSTCSSPPESRLWPERAQNCQGEWSDCSSQSEVFHTGGRRNLTRLERVEEQGMEWAGSPSRRLQSFCQEKEALRCESSSEEQGWEQDCKSPGWRRRLEHPWKGIRSTSLHKRVG